MDELSLRKVERGGELIILEPCPHKISAKEGTPYITRRVKILVYRGIGGQGDRIRIEMSPLKALWLREGSIDEEKKGQRDK